MAKRRSKRTRRSKRAVSKRAVSKRARRSKRARTKRIKLYGGMDGDLVPPIVGQQIQDGDAEDGDEAPAIDMTPGDLHGEIRRLESKIDKILKIQRICCADNEMVREQLDRMDNQDRRSISQKPNVTDELLDLPLEVSDLIMAERAKILRETQGWIIVKGASAWEGKSCPKMGLVERDGQGVSTEIRKGIIEYMGLFGYTEGSALGGHSGHWWPRCQGNAPDDMLQNISKQGMRNTWVAPGASFELIRQKIDEGFIIEFEDDEDRAKL